MRSAQTLVRPAWVVARDLRGRLQSGRILAVRLARSGWNGKSMFIFMRPGDTIRIDAFPHLKSIPDAVKNWFAKNSNTGISQVPFSPCLCMKAADDSIVNGWLASQTDMLAEDWSILEVENSTQ